MDFITFMHGHAQKSGQLDTPEGQGRLTKSIVNSIATMPDVAMHEPFIRRASHVLGIPDIPLFEQLGKVRKSGVKNTPPRQPAPAVVENAPASDMPAYMMDSFVMPAEEDRMEEEEANTSLPEERMLIRLMLDHGNAMVEHIMGNMALVEFSAGVVQSSVKAILSMYDEGKVDKHKLIDGSFGQGVRNLVTEVLMQRHELSKNWERKQKITVPKFNEDPYETAAGTMTLLKLDRVKEALGNLKKRIFMAERSGANVRELLEEQMALHTLQKQIENREFLKWNS